MRIAIVHPYEKAKWTESVQWDGLHAALERIADEHTVDWYLQKEEPDDSYDWILPWGVGSLPFNNTIERYKARKALLCAGHPQDQANFDKFEAIFVESPEVYDQIRRSGYRTVLAFGTDELFYYNRKYREIIYDVFFPGTYSPWKRQNLLTAACRKWKVATCGIVQPDGVGIYQDLEQAGGYVLTGLMPSRIVSYLYNMTRVVVVPAWHGSERTVLEAMASNTPLVLVKDNSLACSLVTDEVVLVDPTEEAIVEAVELALGRKVNTRKHILKNYTSEIYAQKILEVLEK